MNRVREQSGEGLAVLDHIDFLSANHKARNSPLLMLLYLFAWKGCNRGFIREVERTSDSFVRLLQVAMQSA